MKLSFKFFTCIAFFISTTIKSQDLTGMWAGTFHAVTRPMEHSFHFYVDLKQKDRSVWGVYNTTDSANATIFTCLCSISGVLPKKPSSDFELYDERVVDFDAKSIHSGSCRNVQRLFCRYLIKDGIEILVGKWFSTEGANAGTPEGESGYFILRHASNQNFRNPDQYFPKLDKLIAKGVIADASSSKPILIPDERSLTPLEQQLVDAMLGRSQQKSNH